MIFYAAPAPNPTLIAVVSNWASTGLIGFVLGLLSSAWLQKSKSTRDELHLACGELCVTAATAGEVGTKYWLRDGQQADIPELEIRIRGLQRTLSGLAAILRESLHSQGARGVDSALEKFFDTISGGAFGEVDRTADTIRAAQCYLRAADVVVSVRRAFMDKTSLTRRIWRPVIARYNALLPFVGSD
ncbi:MAG TPA: hypothetical protein VHU23_13215 [Rhizomicrobium sp.]|jgi:hypothetical protein|nr:hypothetical protein [Rhizomicrobium sp.]